MKRILIIFLIALSHYCYGQVTWKEKLVKIDNESFQIHITALLETPWHIYSQNLPPGGPIATKITFNKCAGVSINGKVVEKGELIVRHESAFDMDVKYFQDQVDFIQVIKLSTSHGAKLTGNVEFMLCDNNRCLPPTLTSFTFNLP